MHGDVYYQARNIPEGRTSNSSTRQTQSQGIPMSELSAPADPGKSERSPRQYYRSGTYYCSEAIVRTINDEFGLGYPDIIVRLASGFPVGIGGAGCSCGAVTGGLWQSGWSLAGMSQETPALTGALPLHANCMIRLHQRHGCLCCRTLTRWNGTEIPGTPPAVYRFHGGSRGRDGENNHQGDEHVPAIGHRAIT